MHTPQRILNFFPLNLAVGVLVYNAGMEFSSTEQKSRMCSPFFSNTKTFKYPV